MVYFVLTPRCFAYRHAATTFYQLQRGIGGRRQHARIQEFLSVLFSPQLILQFTEGTPMVLLLSKLYLTRIQRGFIIFQGVSNFFQGGGGGGVEMLISLNSHIRTCCFPGSCPDPLSPSGSIHGQCRHNGTIFITVPLLTIIARHCFVRINDRWVFFPNNALVLRTFDTFEKHSSWNW